MSFQVEFEPIGKRVQYKADVSLLECAHQNGIGINSICAGKGTCHSCKIQVVEGNLTSVSASDLTAFSEKQINDGWRLACQMHPTGNVRVNIPPESMISGQRTQTEGLSVPVACDPVVKLYPVKIPAPTSTDLLADSDRLLNSLNTTYKLDNLVIDINVIRELPRKLRNGDWQCQAAIRGNDIISIATKSDINIGLAVDLGSTKIAGYLVNLDSGQVMSSRGIMNPQIKYGEDIISRLERAIKSASEGKILQEILVDAITKMATDLCRNNHISPENIMETVIVGNTAMQHLLLYLPVEQLAKSPFISAVNDALDIKSREIGLHFAPGAYIHMLPNIAGFIGSDHTAVLLALADIYDKGKTLILDIGTNTEVSLVKDDRIFSVSCASGPAFEGGFIKHGMRAADGAIEHIRLTDDAVQFQTIGETSPTGLCGSAILDAAAQLYSSKVIDRGGRMQNNHTRIRTTNNQVEFVIVPDDEKRGKSAITVTQKDIREIQLAKGAIRAGIQVLLETANLSENDLDRIIIAGAFGTYIDINSAINIGMLPELPREKYLQVGNAAGTGARIALISHERRIAAKRIAARVHYIELGTAPNFNDIFINSTYFGPYKTKIKNPE